MVEVKVEYDYDAEQDDELSIHVGNIIKNVTRSEGGWWEGELNGNRGLFPDNFVKVIKPIGKDEEKKEEKKEEKEVSNKMSKQGHIAEMANKIKDGVQVDAMLWKKQENIGRKKLIAKVQFDYKPENDDELELHAGESVEIIKQEEEGWLRGTLNGKEGVFPTNFVEIHETDEKEKSGKLDEPEKESAPEVKVKKVKGVGLGNIFSGGPIKLRPASGIFKKPSDDQENKSEKSPVNVVPLPKRQKAVEKALVRFSYHAENDDELSLEEGDVITVLEKELEDHGWWKGEIRGKIGVFPDNFVEPLPSEETKPKKPAVPPNQKHSVKVMEIASGHNRVKSEKHSQAAGLDRLLKKKDEPEAVDKPQFPPPALPSKKPALPPPVGKKPLPLRPELPKLDNKIVCHSMNTVTSQISSHTTISQTVEQKSKDVQKESTDLLNFEALELPSEKLVHLTANRAKQPHKRPPSQIFLHMEEEKNGDIKESALSKNDKNIQPIPPPPLQPIKSVKKDELINKDSEKRKSGIFTTLLAAESTTKVKPILPDLSATKGDPNCEAIEELQRELKELRSSMVPRAAFDELKAQNDRLHQDIEALRALFNKKFLDIINEIDEEKKVRLNMQVEIERIRKLVIESTI